MSNDALLPATARRRRQARMDGQVARSQTLIRAGVLGGGLLTAAAFGASLVGHVAQFTKRSTVQAFEGGTALEGVTAAFELLGELLLPFLAVCFGVAVIVAVAQVGGLFTVRPLVPRLSRLTPSPRGDRTVWWDVVRGVVVLAVGAVASRWAAPTLLVVSRETFPAALGAFVGAITTAATGAVIVLLLLGGLDWVYVRSRYERRLRMTAPERRDEQRQTEADPSVRSRLRVFADGASGSTPAQGAEGHPTPRMRTPAGEVEARD